MSEQEPQQRTIFGEPLTEQVRFETTGRVIRPFRRILNQIVGEFKLEVDESGLYVRAVDKHNVQMVEIQLHSDALESLSVADETVLGIQSQTFGGALQHARYGKNTDDPIVVSSDGEKLETETTREVGQSDATINERVSLLDPDSVRERPDIPELDFGTHVELEPETFIEVLKLMDLDSDTHIKLGANTESIVFKQESDLTKRNVEIDCNPSGVTEWAIFSADYMEKLRNVIRDGYVDTLTLKWDTEYPLYAEFEREDVYEGTVMIAPRVSDRT